MKSFYEKNREDDGKLLVHGASEGFPAHYHRNLEIPIVLCGEQKLSVNDKELTLKDGCLTVIDSYDVHAYKKFDGEKTGEIIVIIPYEYMQSFNARRQGLRAQADVIDNPALCQRLADIVNRFMRAEQPTEVRRTATALFLAVLYENIAWTHDRGKDEATLVRNILTHIHENYRLEISRSTIAHALGYTEAHVSRVFHRYLKTGISSYVNRLRLAYIERLRADGDGRTTIELIYEAGFQSQQTYYRCRKQLL